jgi:hypothetical protein
MDRICTTCGRNAVSDLGVFIDIPYRGLLRINVQDMVRRLGPSTPDEERQVIETKRQTLTLMLVKLKRLQDAAGVITVAPTLDYCLEDEEDFDEDGESASASDGVQSQRATRVTDAPGVEREQLAMPSNGTVTGQAVEVELRHRANQARREIDRLRDIIADISFQYSHVIRGAIRKSIRTASQKRIKALHNDLVLHARIYSRCRSRLIALKCDERWLRTFRALHRSDLKASTAILDPNIPGSSSLRLSWIWQTGRWHFFHSDTDADTDADRHDVSDPASLLECS